MSYKARFGGMRALAAGITAAALVGAAVPASADRDDRKPPAGFFRHLGTFDVIAGNGSQVAEIVDVTVNGKQLVYTDSPSGQIGFVDISDPRNPTGQGAVDVGGEPTSLVVLDPLVLVGVNTSEGDFVNPSGKLVVVHRNTRQIVAEYALAGQPDSLALAPDRKRAVIVIENERNELLETGPVLGLLPQPPTGALLIVDLRGAPQKWKISAADLGPVAAAAANGTDLEPEYVDVNERNRAVVSFQENNHLAVVDIVTGRTVNQFSAGSATLNDVDTARNSLISLDTDNVTRRREPDGVAWIDADSFATANEGDYTDAAGQGGSRGFTIFNVNGTVEYESAESFEHWIVRAGHYNERRSNSKGVEPESVAASRFGDRKLLFVGSERSNAVGVYDVGGAAPVPVQLLPTGIGPEGLRAIPRRGLFVASTETSNVAIGIPTMINVYGLTRGPAAYPMIESANDAAGLPIPWVALSGLAGDPADPDQLYAVSDSYLAKGFVYAIDASTVPAKIVRRIEVTGAAPAALDLEGVAVGPDGSLWLGSEGNGTTRPNLVLKVDPQDGEVLAQISLPAALESGTDRRNNGIEGVAVTGAPGSEVIFVVIQRAWLNKGDTDGVNTKIGRYDVATGLWTFVHYPLEPVAGGDWIGLSELTLLPDGKFAVIERDKGWGPSTGFNAELKALFTVDLATAPFRALDLTQTSGGLATIQKSLLRDVVPDLAARSIWTPEKLEGFAIGADGDAYVVTDNDGVNGSGSTDIYPGETVFLNLGPLSDFEEDDEDDEDED